MISALRGWRRKKRKNFEEWDLDFEKFITKINKHAFMVNVNGTSYGYPKLIHKGGRPSGRHRA